MNTPSLLVSPQVNAQFVHDLFGDAIGPFHVAGRAEADVDDEPSPRLEAEEVVETGHAGHLGGGNLKELGHGVQLLAAK